MGRIENIVENICGKGLLLRVLFALFALLRDLFYGYSR